MAYRTTPLACGEYYHIYNRGVAQQPIFITAKHCNRFLTCLDYYRFPQASLRLSYFLNIPEQERDIMFKKIKEKERPLVSLIAFALMPNHFHLLIRQITENGISKYIKRVSDSYSRYFNVINKRTGPMFQGSFKAAHVESNEQLLHLSRYIHLNPLVSFVVNDNDFKSYPWSSLKDYLSDDRLSIVDRAIILDQFKGSKEYLKFIMDQVEYAKALEWIKHLTLELD